MTAGHKLLVRRLVEEAVNAGSLQVLDEVARGDFAVAARPVTRWRSGQASGGEAGHRGQRDG